MKTQFDYHVRIVSLENLRAMCARAGGTCHTYEISKISRSRVHVTYSNPNEYGTPDPITAVFPCYPSTHEGSENPAVIIGEMIRCIGDKDGYGYQAFDLLTCGQPVYRDPSTGAWSTRLEIDGTDHYLCPDNKVRKVDQYHPYTDDRTAAFDITAETSAETFARIGGTRHFAYFTWTDLRPAKPGMYGRPVEV